MPLATSPSSDRLPDASSMRSSGPADGCFRQRGRTGRGRASGWTTTGSGSAPGPRCGTWLHRTWWKIRVEAGLPDVRLHDLRHTHASLALRQGETVLAIGRLLGHRNTETTLKYTHPADTMVMDAAETIGIVLEG